MKISGFVFLLLSGIFYSQAVAGTGIEIIYPDGIVSGMERFFQTVMPGKSFEIVIKNDSGSINADAKKGTITAGPDGKWRYTAPPESGSDEIVITDKINGQRTNISVFVLTPLRRMKGEYLNGYRIGHYQEKALKGNKNYRKPEGLIEVTRQNENTPLSPHFVLRQFLCKQKSGWPKYLTVNPKLIRKLELIIDVLAEKGIKVSTLFIMSGYRTPHYNKSLGNVKYSRHVYGDAADIYVDENGDGIMDDLDGDGKSGMSDAEFLASVAAGLDENPSHKNFIGGIGKYQKTRSHTWFIHVDTRGYKARW
jgi:hypothetical protein